MKVQKIVQLCSCLMFVTALHGAPARQKAGDVFSMHCAVCHGADLNSGLGGSLIDGEWKIENTDAAILEVITKGHPDMEMQAFEDILTAEQKRSLVIFIREKEKEERYKNSQFPEPAKAEVVKTQHHSYKMEVVNENVKNPWAVAFLPDGRFLVTEKAGPVVVLDKGGKKNAPVKGTPKSVSHGQGGMMDVAVHPDYEKNGWIYLAFAEGEEVDGRMRSLTTIMRGRIKANEWQDEEVIWRGDEEFRATSGAHFGSRIVFRDGYVFFVIGERGGMMEVQDVTRPNGKIFRLHDDGRVPEDNPFVGQADAVPGIWSYGHRNPQGLVFDGRNGDLYSTEHGPRGGDEFNLILPGRNYGWPVITHGMNYDGTPITGITEKEGMEQPVIHWTPSIAACGLAFYEGDKFPQWEHDFFAGGLASQEVRRLRVKDRKVVEQELVLKGAGRVRDVKTGPDGYLYIVHNNPDRVVRLIPAK